MIKVTKLAVLVLTLSLCSFAATPYQFLTNFSGTHSGGTALAASTTGYAAIQGFADNFTVSAAKNAAMVMTHAGTATSLTVVIGDAQPASGSLTIALYDQTTSTVTTLSEVLAAGTNPGTYQTGATASLTQGHSYAMQFVNAATAISADVISVSFVIENNTTTVFSVADNEHSIIPVASGTGKNLCGANNADTCVYQGLQGWSLANYAPNAAAAATALPAACTAGNLYAVIDGTGKTTASLNVDIWDKTAGSAVIVLGIASGSNPGTYADTVDKVALTVGHEYEFLYVLGDNSASGPPMISTGFDCGTNNAIYSLDTIATSVAEMTAVNLPLVGLSDEIIPLNDQYIAWPASCTARSMYVVTNSAQPVSGDMTVNMFDASIGFGSNLTVTIPADGVAGVYFDTSDLDSVSATSRYYYRVTNNAGMPSAKIQSISFVCD